MKIDIGKKLREARVAAGFTQKQIYEKIGVPQSTFSSWETGKSEPDGNTIILLCNLYGIQSFNEFYDESSEFGNENLSRAEKSLVENYRYLDTHGKDIVDSIIIKEVERIKQLEGEQEMAKLEKGLKALSMISKANENDKYKHHRQLPLYEYPASAGRGVFTGQGEYELVDVPDDVPLSTTFGVRIKGDSMMPKILDGAIAWVKQQPDVDFGEMCIVVIGDEGYCKIKTKEGFRSLNIKYKTIRPNEYETCRISGKVVYVENPK